MASSLHYWTGRGIYWFFPAAIPVTTLRASWVPLWVPAPASSCFAGGDNCLYLLVRVVHTAPRSVEGHPSRVCCVHPLYYSSPLSSPPARGSMGMLLTAVQYGRHSTIAWLKVQYTVEWRFRIGWPKRKELKRVTFCGQGSLKESQEVT